MNFVLDASIALSWCFSDEATPKTVGLLEALEKSTAFVPSLWYLEIGNILVMAEKRKRISHAKISEFFSLIEALAIQVDDYNIELSYKTVFSIAYEEKLTTYDATYLELAMRGGFALASKDHDLLKAAKRKGVKVLTA